MSFRSGSVSYARFQVTGALPSFADPATLARLGEHVIGPAEARIGDPPDVEVGWVTGRHLLDTRFDPEETAFGPCALLGLRVDTHAVPAEIKRAYRAMAEAAVAESAPDGVLGRSAKLAAYEEARAQWREERAAGRWRRSRLLPVLLDVERGVLLAPAFGDAVATALREHVHETFGATVAPMSSGSLAWSMLAGRGSARDYDELEPSAFTAPPPDVETADETRPDVPTVPWSAGGPEPKDFLGNEFLLWLWWHGEEQQSLATAEGRVDVVLDRRLELACAWGAGGTLALVADGPARRPEARVGLQAGKWPRKVGLVLAAGGESWELALQADRFTVTGARLPKPEDARTPRDLLEARVASVCTLDRALVALYGEFLRQRLDRRWATVVERIRHWVRRRGRPEPTVTVVEPKAPAEAPAVTA